jgi:hypothetical protein
VTNGDGAAAAPCALDGAALAADGAFPDPRAVHGSTSAVTAAAFPARSSHSRRVERFIEYSFAGELVRLASLNPPMPDPEIDDVEFVNVQVQVPGRISSNTERPTT